ncbi:histidine kinase CKI1-like [Capsicum annuum]
MNLSSFKMSRVASVCLILALLMLLVPPTLITFWVRKFKKMESEIKDVAGSSLENNLLQKCKVYAPANVQDVQLSHFHQTIKFGLMLIILMMVALAVSIITFVILIIRSRRREMLLYDELTKQIEATQEAIRKSMNKSTAFVQANHDLSVSLASINGLIELCRGTPHASPESELVNYLNMMESCTNDLLGFLSSVLDQSKIERGKKYLKEEEFDMEDLLEHVVNMNYPNGAKKNVDVVLDPCNGSITKFSRVKGDRAELRRILSNLLHNAVKFTSEGHIIVRAWARKTSFDQSRSISPKTSTGWLSCLHARKDESTSEVQDTSEVLVLNSVQKDPNCMELVFEVEDTGKGIPKEKQTSVFENFVQVDDESNTGIGLGLGIAQSLVGLMGGKLGIVGKNIGEEGTCFRFNVFLIACDQPQAQESQATTVNYAREDDLESLTGGGSVASSSRFKPETSNAILFIKEEERSRVLRRFMMNVLGLRVHVVNQHEQFSQTLKMMKENIIKVASRSNSFSSSSIRSQEISLHALYVTNVNDCIDISSSQRRGRGLSSRISLIRFVLIVIDTSAGPIREMTQAMTEFRKDLPKDVSLRVVWLENPGADKDKLPSTDIVIAKPLHGSNLYRALRDVPEFRDKILPTITQEMKEETIQHVSIDVPGPSGSK